MGNIVSRGLPVAVSAVFVIWVIHMVDEPAKIWKGISSASLPLLAAIVPVSLLSHWFRATRWCRFIGKPLPRSYAFSSVMIGYAVNAVIPRGGEIARIVNMNRTTHAPYPSLFATLIAERILDVVVLVGFLGFSLILDGQRIRETFPTVARLGPSVVALAAGGLILMILLGFSGEFFSRVAGRVAGSLHEGFGKRLEVFARQGAEGFSLVRRPLPALLAAVETAAIWALYWLCFALGLSAFGLLDGIGYQGATVTFTLTSFSMMVPSQGAIGVFHTFGQKALSQLYQVDVDQALAWATVVHAILMLGVGVLCGVVVWALQGFFAPAPKDQFVTKKEDVPFDPFSR